MRIVVSMLFIGVGLALIRYRAWWGWKRNARWWPGAFADPDADARRWLELWPILIGGFFVAAGAVSITVLIVS